MPTRRASAPASRSSTGASASEPAITRDGVEIALSINAGLLMDMPRLEESGAVGVGLFRTELQFMVASSFPRLTSRRHFYRQVLDAANGKPVTFRSLDVGGDKVLPISASRGRRIRRWAGGRSGSGSTGRRCSARRRARCCKPPAGRELRLMFPMVTEVVEFERAKAIVMRELNHLDRHGQGSPKRSCSAR